MTSELNERAKNRPQRYSVISTESYSGHSVRQTRPISRPEAGTDIGREPTAAKQMQLQLCGRWIVQIEPNRGEPAFRAVFYGRPKHLSVATLDLSCDFSVAAATGHDP